MTAFVLLARSLGVEPASPPASSCHPTSSQAPLGAAVDPRRGVAGGASWTVIGWLAFDPAPGAGDERREAPPPPPAAQSPAAAQPPIAPPGRAGQRRRHRITPDRADRHRQLGFVSARGSTRAGSWAGGRAAVRGRDGRDPRSIKWRGAAGAAQRDPIRARISGRVGQHAPTRWSTPG